MVLIVHSKEGITYQAARRKIFKETARRPLHDRPSYAEATTSTQTLQPMENQEIAPSPIIRTNNFKNSTFGQLTDTSTSISTHPDTPEIPKNNRKRILSNPTSLDPKKHSNTKNSTAKTEKKKK